MPIITVTSDWKKDDFYIGAIKGYVASNSANTQVISITNQIENFNISQAAFILRNTFQHYPKGTVHLICINSEIKENYNYLIIEYEGHYFIGADNGIFGLLIKDTPTKIFKINIEENDFNSFPELSIFAKYACKIVLKEKISSFANEITDYYKQIPYRPAIEENSISGSIIYIDSYKNAISNISKELFDRYAENKNFEMFVQSHHYKITRINKKYNETTPGELLAIFNSIGLLEIAINNGNAAELLGLGIGSNIRIKFK